MATGRATSRLAGGKAATFRWWPNGRKDLRMAAGFGMRDALLYAEDRAKADAVVRGGHRSFLTGAHLGGPLGIRDMPGTTRAKARVGGTLRRSIYMRVTVDGQDLPGSRRTDENGKTTPPPGRSTVKGGIVGALGTNSGYGGWVDQGTSRMPARPMIMPALQAMASVIGGLFRGGWTTYISGRR